ncbi:hypothetical protein GCM10010873_19580 [Cypionkella aquatica]|uniref:Uncharacterized protein n=1 Tax=Cypionkella aquatica TaxID=1756042 RepID=A0AA37TSI0_9RHOB|nr:hypothetical protein [Cypionkella aquatica]GLS86984.1 hypothetical protein GCM10010873_19580 [Cypionkella aquatica]
MIGAFFLLALVAAGFVQAPAWLILPFAGALVLISRFIPLIGRIGWMLRALLSLAVTAMAYGLGASFG